MDYLIFKGDKNMFRRYPKIENSYRQKTINMFLKHHPELENEWYVIQHKYDGANISLIFMPDRILRIATRNRVLGFDEDFHDVWNVVTGPEYKELLKFGFRNAIRYNTKIQIFGELFGSGIQKRIDYGDDKYFRVFDICFENMDGDTVFWEQKLLCGDPVLSKYMVEVFSMVMGLNNALDYKPHRFDEIEGVVIKPFDNVYFSPQGSIFYLKNKNPKFEEKGNKVKKDNKPKFSEDVENLHREFIQYINENRVLSVFSKIGEIQDPKQIGMYIKEVLNDAKEDFAKDGFDVSGHDKKEQKYIFNVGSMVVDILNKYL